MRLHAALILALALTLPGRATTYEIRPAPGSHLMLQVFKTGLMSGRKHVFLFPDYGGAVRFDPAAPEGAQVELRIQGGSAVCTDTWVSRKDLQKIQDTALNQMMQVREHPELLFSSTQITRLGPARYQVTGSLTVRGVAKPVTVQVNVTEQSPQSLSFSGRAEVRLKDYGLKPPGAALGAIGTRNEMTVDFKMKATAAAGP